MTYGTQKGWLDKPLYLHFPSGMQQWRNLEYGIVRSLRITLTLFKKVHLKIYACYGTQNRSSGGFFASWWYSKLFYNIGLLLTILISRKGQQQYENIILKDEDSKTQRTSSLSCWNWLSLYFWLRRALCFSHNIVSCLFCSWFCRIISMTCETASE